MFAIGMRRSNLIKVDKKYIEKGLEGLAEPIKHQLKSRLDPEKQQEIKRMILNERPTRYEIDREIWTGEIIRAIIKKRWGVDLKTSRICEISTYQEKADSKTSSE